MNHLSIIVRLQLVVSEAYDWWQKNDEGKNNMKKEKKITNY